MKQKLFTLLAVSALTAASAIAAIGDRATTRQESPFVISFTPKATQGTPLTPAPAKAPAYADEEQTADVPRPVESMTQKPGADYGEVILSWTPVTKMVSGADVPANLTYTVCQLTQSGIVPVMENLTETTATVRACAADAEQTFTMYAIYAVIPAEGDQDERVSAGGAYTGLIPVGKPETMPYRESFTLDHVIANEILAGDAEWEIFTDAYVPSQDHDDACMMFTSTKTYDSGRIETARIHIDENAADPTFAFFIYAQKLQNSAGEPMVDPNQIQVQVNDGSGFKNVGSAIDMTNFVVMEWNRAFVSLADYKGKDVQIAIRVTCRGCQTEFLDNMQVYDRPASDASVILNTDGVTRTKIGETIPLIANVFNYGNTDAKGYTVTFFSGSHKIGVASGPDIAPGSQEEVEFDYEIPASSEETLDFSARVEVAGDADNTNNESLPVSVHVTLPTLPSVSQLTFKNENDGSVTLNWSEPVYADMAASFTEDFEDFGSFATWEQGDTGDWLFVDRDEYPVGGMKTFDFPNMPKESKQTFFVMDRAWVRENLPAVTAKLYETHSGDKMLGAMYCFGTNFTNDDWAISPLLSGKRQTITFYARPYDGDFVPELLDVLYSTTDRDPANFRLLKSFKIDGDYRMLWTECTANLPAGAKYFAFRYCSTYQWMILIDDVTYQPGGQEDLALDGYNVYSDDTKLNDTPVTERTFKVKNPVENAAYSVTACYAQGESRASNRVVPVTSGVESVNKVAAIVRAASGNILVAGTDAQVEVFDLQGRRIYAGEAGVIPAASGAYIVRIPDMTRKVLVP